MCIKVFHAAGEFFLVALIPEKGKDKLVGYVCGTLTASGRLTHESMARHDPEGTALCIHSVCVDREHRCRGYGMRMVQAYILFVRQTKPQVRALALACSSH